MSSRSSRTCHQLSKPSYGGASATVCSSEVPSVKRACSFDFTRNRRTAAGGIAFTLANCNHRRVAIRIDIKAIVAALLNGERHVRSVHFVDLATEQLTHMEVQCALVHSTCTV